VEIVPVSVGSVTDFFIGRMKRIDALVFPAERGSYFTLLYPAFSVAVPHPLVIRFPLVYPAADRDLEFARFLGIWIDLQRKTARFRRFTTTGFWDAMRAPSSRAGRSFATYCTG
jgi:hypothetical protein